MEFENILLRMINTFQDKVAPHEMFTGLISVAVSIAVQNFEIEDESLLIGMVTKTLEDAFKQSEIHFGPSPGDG